MKINSNDELTQIIGEGFLWAIVGNYAETHLELLKEALRPLGYIDCEDVDKITVAKVQETDEFIVNEFSAKDGILTVKYEMPAGILAKNDDDSVCFHVITLCTGEAEIPDIDSYNWNGIEFDRLNRTQILAYSNLVKTIRLSYEDTKVGDEAVCCMKRPIYENKAIEDNEVDDEVVCSKEQSIFENRTILGITCIPYIVILYAAIYSYFVGFRWMEGRYDGWIGVINALEFIGLILVASPLGIIRLVCVIYQITYFEHWSQKRKDKNNNRVNTGNN